MRGACKLQGRKVRCVVMTAHGGRRRDVVIHVIRYMDYGVKVWYGIVGFNVPIDTL